ncbi:hypothetical protein [Myroides odoratimimus]|uniref:Uncharacterized protein n=2 Tax=Myroides odoratimimus TaxID=76832 RepID=A0AAI8G603_9FLAO|nr:hypothetical protein [Myroides odoratimimus]ALU27391.1 hypothetical protein AS202_15035 [Myroides odoratimimus]EHO13057.1 hypothetical protein HMPREF9715_01464 [Myroides odoratimimus CIP 101113]MDM1039593.1 hypothetical protein [Myroides odoratimimus]MDM1053800.1 hypothetical protein [Myroides odoratimimus]MDM1086610.1 hypothetical protein [Myroides odoratimimus]
MEKLSLDTLKMRAEAITSEDLLATISGGTENSCHNEAVIRHVDHVQGQPRPGYTPLGEAILRWIFG